MERDRASLRLPQFVDPATFRRQPARHRRPPRRPAQPQLHQLQPGSPGRQAQVTDVDQAGRAWTTAGAWSRRSGAPPDVRQRRVELAGLDTSSAGELRNSTSATAADRGGSTGPAPASASRGGRRRPPAANAQAGSRPSPTRSGPPHAQFSSVAVLVQAVPPAPMALLYGSDQDQQQGHDQAHRAGQPAGEHTMSRPPSPRPAVDDRRDLPLGEVDQLRLHHAGRSSLGALPDACHPLPRRWFRWRYSACRSTRRRRCR